MSRAVIFSGQGAQAVGMGKDLVDAFPACKKLYDIADETLGYSISDICFEGPVEELTKSNNAQPAIFVTSIACFTALKESCPDISFAGTAGLSLGEWSALHAAGVLSFEDTLRILEARGRFMQDACNECDSTMLSIIGLSMPDLEKICEDAGVTIANLNSPAQTVLAGERANIEKATALAQDAGAKRAIPLNVAGAFHSPLMESAAVKLAETLAAVEFKQPTMPIVANVTGLPHDAATIRETMLKQVTGSVRWQTSIEWFKANGVTEYIECGPGKVLTGLIKRIDSSATLHNINNVATLEKTVAGIA
ncbi:MAG: ACP S-malonyltransferase [Kiritimatiellae bacterium]|nr:ACP S-malonyltransferase [Kiritimatiellia bacterium]